MDLKGISFGSGGLRYAVLASETPEGKAREQAYYETLGRFVQMFAEAEKVVAETLWRYARTSHPVAKIIFAGTQSDHAATYIKALAEATGASPDQRADLENVFQQFGIIRGARNHILHFGADQVAEGKATVSNAWKAKSEPTEFPISPRSLSEMRDDLRKIIAHLGYRHLGRPWPKGALSIAALEATLRSSWHYKHPVQQKSQTKKAESRPARKRPPRPPLPRISSEE